MSEEKSFGSRFKALVAALAISQAEFGRTIDKKPAFITDVVSGRSMLSAETLILLRSKHNVNPLWLLTGEGEMFLNEQRQMQVQDAKRMIQEQMQARLREKENPELARALELVRKNPKLAKLVEKLGLLGEEELLRLEGYVDGMREKS